MDYDMPIMDGSQSIRLIRKNEVGNSLKKCYIVGCTAFAGQELHKLLEEAGADIVMTKPINLTIIEKLNINLNICGL